MTVLDSSKPLGRRLVHRIKGFGRPRVLSFLPMRRCNPSTVQDNIKAKEAQPDDDPRDGGRIIAQYS